MSVCQDVDVLIHAAGPNSEQSSLNSFSIKEYMQHTTNLSIAAKDSKIKKIIYLSTIHVYKNNLEGVINEQTPTLNKKSLFLI